MNYYKPCQRQHDLRWDYTCENNGKIYPVGYCRAAMSLSDAVPEELRKKHDETQHKHHTNGHATAEEAAACYTEFLLDHRLMFYDIVPYKTNDRNVCAVCEVQATHIARIGGGFKSWPLCRDHLNRETVKGLFHVSASEVMISSY